MQMQIDKSARKLKGRGRRQDFLIFEAKWLKWLKWYLYLSKQYAHYFLISQAPITEHFVFSNYQCNANWWDTKVEEGAKICWYFKHPQLKWLSLYPYLSTHSVQQYA